MGTRELSWEDRRECGLTIRQRGDVTFHQYALTFEGNALGTLVAITSSNALTATLGVF